MSIFWDTKKQDIDEKKNKDFIITRTLEHGYLLDIKKLLKTYSDKDIKNTIKESRNLSARTAWFWSYYFNIPSNQIRCLKNPYIKIPKALWPY